MPLIETADRTSLFVTDWGTGPRFYSPMPSERS